MNIYLMDDVGLNDADLIFGLNDADLNFGLNVDLNFGLNDVDLIFGLNDVDSCVIIPCISSFTSIYFD